MPKLNKRDYTEEEKAILFRHVYIMPDFLPKLIFRPSSSDMNYPRNLFIPLTLNDESIDGIFTRHDTDCTYLEYNGNWHFDQILAGNFYIADSTRLRSLVTSQAVIKVLDEKGWNEFIPPRTRIRQLVRPSHPYNLPEYNSSRIHVEYESDILAGPIVSLHYLKKNK